MIEWPVGLFLAAIPLVKLLDRNALPRAIRFGVHVFDGMAKPVGGDAEGTVRMVRTPPRLRKAADRVAGASPRRRPRSASVAAQQRTQAVPRRQQRRPVVDEGRG